MKVRCRICEDTVLFAEAWQTQMLPPDAPFTTQATTIPQSSEPKGESDRKGPAMLQSHIPELAGELASKYAGDPPGV